MPSEALLGVAITDYNTRGEFMMPRVFCSQADELVVEAPAVAPFAAPLVPLDRLATFRPEPSGPHRLRVGGLQITAPPRALPRGDYSRRR